MEKMNFEENKNSIKKPTLSAIKKTEKEKGWIIISEHPGQILFGKEIYRKILDTKTLEFTQSTNGVQPIEKK